YRLEVDWGASGTIAGKLFDSDGKTLLRTVTATTTSITSGGIAFRAIGYDKYFDTVTVARGVNGSIRQAAAVPPSRASSGLAAGGPFGDASLRDMESWRRAMWQAALHGDHLGAYDDALIARAVVR